MDAAKIQVKLYAASTSRAPVPLDTFVPIFHDWIRNHVLPELMIDVASYEHVPNGPGVLFVGHGSDYFMEEGKGRLGLLYSRKRAGPAPADRLADAFRRTLHVAGLLEQDSRLAGNLRFRTDEILIRVNDRLAAPSTDATLTALKPELEVFCKTLFAGREFTLARTSDARELFAVTVRLKDAATAPALPDLLGRIGGAPTS